MLGCALSFGGPKGAKDSKPAHSLKFGPLPCYLVPPKGFLTGESGSGPLDPSGPWPDSRAL